MFSISLRSTLPILAAANCECSIRRLAQDFCYFFGRMKGTRIGLKETRINLRETHIGLKEMRIGLRETRIKGVSTSESNYEYLWIYEIITTFAV